MILFISDFPTKETVKEGMSQRILAIDEHFNSEHRTYLFVSHRRFFKKIQYEIKPGVFQYRCNLLLHFWLILSLLRKSDTLYFHSIINAFTIFPYLYLNLTNKKIILDVHGIVPEEQLLNGNALKSKLYELCEKRLFNIMDFAIVVTDKMKKFYLKKYPHSAEKIRYITYPIIPKHLVENVVNSKDIQGYSSQKIEIIYSGNTQKWQNIPMMVEKIKNNLSEDINYTILTGEPELMIKEFVAQNINPENCNIVIKSVMPIELREYYVNAHYGFILRDDIEINNVACPTKMVEYLYYGIIPIVKCEEIGDFKAKNYEYLKIEDFVEENLQCSKSITNHKIAANIIEKSVTNNIANML